MNNRCPRCGADNENITYGTAQLVGKVFVCLANCGRCGHTFVVDAKVRACSACKRVLSVELFYKNRNKPISKCKECMKTISHRHRQECADYYKRYRLGHKKETKEYNKRYRQRVKNRKTKNE